MLRRGVGARNALAPLPVTSQELKGLYELYELYELHELYELYELY